MEAHDSNPNDLPHSEPDSPPPSPPSGSPSDLQHSIQSFPVVNNPYSIHDECVHLNPMICSKNPKCSLKNYAGNLMFSKVDTTCVNTDDWDMKNKSFVNWNSFAQYLQSKNYSVENGPLLNYMKNSNIIFEMFRSNPQYNKQHYMGIDIDEDGFKEWLFTSQHKRTLVRVLSPQEIHILSQIIIDGYMKLQLELYEPFINGLFDIINDSKKEQDLSKIINDIKILSEKTPGLSLKTQGNLLSMFFQPLYHSHSPIVVALNEYWEREWQAKHKSVKYNMARQMFGNQLKYLKYKNKYLRLKNQIIN